MDADTLLTPRTLTATFGLLSSIMDDGSAGTPVLPEATADADPLLDDPAFLDLEDLALLEEFALLAQTAGPAPSQDGGGPSPQCVVPDVSGQQPPALAVAAAPTLPLPLYSMDEATPTAVMQTHAASSETAFEDATFDADNDGRLSCGSSPSSSRSSRSSSRSASGSAAGSAADSDRPFAKRARPQFAQDLSETEIRLLKKEGFVFPQGRRLTKEEERELKVLRRKIKNKMSAQDSRKRKKEEATNMRRRVDEYKNRAVELEEEVAGLTRQNASLAAQLQQMRMRISKLLPAGASVSSALLLLGACFTVYTSPATSPALGGAFAPDVFDASANGCPADSGSASWLAPEQGFRARTLLDVDDDDVEAAERRRRRQLEGDDDADREVAWTLGGVDGSALQHDLRHTESLRTATPQVTTESWQQFKQLSQIMAGQATSAPVNETEETEADAGVALMSRHFATTTHREASVFGAASAAVGGAAMWRELPAAPA